MCVHVCTCMHRKFFAKRAGAVVSIWLALNFHSINDGTCRNSTKYCKADEIVVVINAWMRRINRSISMVIWIEVWAIISMYLILWYSFVKCHSPTSISSADLFYFHWMTLTSSQIDSLPPFNRQQYAILREFYFPNVTTFSLLIVWQVEIPASTSVTNGSW